MVCFKNNYKYILSFFINFTIFANVINANVLVFLNYLKRMTWLVSAMHFPAFRFNLF